MGCYGNHDCTIRDELEPGLKTHKHPWQQVGKFGYFVAYIRWYNEKRTRYPLAHSVP